jgi:hypothetical protein
MIITYILNINSKELHRESLWKDMMLIYLLELDESLK